MNEWYKPTIEELDVKMTKMASNNTFGNILSCVTPPEAPDGASCSCDGNEGNNGNNGNNDNNGNNGNNNGNN
jgi:hypothetical protein